jgi:hypothetical protein
LPSTPIQESLLQPLNSRYLEAAKKFKTNFGGLKESDFSTNHASDWKATQRLIDENKKAFTVDDGFDIIKSRYRT